MASDDFITLESHSDSENQEEDKGPLESNSVLNEVDYGFSTGVGVRVGGNFEATEENDEIEEGEHVQDMDLESDGSPERSFINKSSRFLGPSPTPGRSPLDATNLLVDSNSTRGAQRDLVTNTNQEACVHVVYKSLTRESKKKLMDLMQHWSEWHSQSKSCSNVNSEEALESGEEIYFPALYVGSENASAVSYWVDNQARNEDFTSIKLDHDSVPLYDRECTLASTSLGDLADSGIETLEASRCFNCGSYSHSLKECPKPRDSTAINSARKQHNEKKNSTPGSRGQVRYYQKSQGKFDDLKPGSLTPELRACLGIGALDPPPWFRRMHDLGYPPGYLEDDDDENTPSGITIFGAEEPKADYEDGELPERGDPGPAEKRKAVAFPGINAPIPEGADQILWATPLSPIRDPSHHRSSYLPDSQRGRYTDNQNDGSASRYRSSESHRGRYHDQRRADGPPGTSYSQRYSPYDHSSSPHSSRSLHFGRSLSERDFHSPARYDGFHNSYPLPCASRDTSFDRWVPSHGSPRAPASERPEHHHHHQRHRTN